jgi:hypothetical protein
MWGVQPYAYCISEVIYYLVSSYVYNGRQIGQRVAQEWAVHWASHGGPATRTQRRSAPHAQPVAYVRQRAGRWPLLTPRGCTTPAPRSDGGPPCGRTWEEQRHHRSLVPREAMPTRRSSFRLLGPTGGNVRPAAISSNVFFNNRLVAHCPVDGHSAEFPKKSSTGNFRQMYPVKVPPAGIYGGKVPVQECKTAHVALLLPPIARSLP